jgi:hypothetical protein
MKQTRCRIGLERKMFKIGSQVLPR